MNNTYRPLACLTFGINEVQDLYFEVKVIWSGPEPLDRPDVGGWLFNHNQRKLAERLVKAINSGVVFKNPRVVKDIHGATYVEAEQTQFFHKRHMNKALQAVGF